MKQPVVLVVLLAVLAVASASAQVPAGGVFQVNTYTTGNQAAYAVAASAGGNFVVVWRSEQDGGGLFGQVFDASGARRGSEFQVDTYTTYSGQFGTRVAADEAGRFVVVWEDYSDCGEHDGLWAQLYASDG